MEKGTPQPGGTMEQEDLLGTESGVFDVKENAINFPDQPRLSQGSEIIQGQQNQRLSQGSVISQSQQKQRLSQGSEGQQGQFIEGQQQHRLSQGSQLYQDQDQDQEYDEDPYEYNPEQIVAEEPLQDDEEEEVLVISIDDGEPMRPMDPKYIPRNAYPDVPEENPAEVQYYMDVRAIAKLHVTRWRPPATVKPIPKPKESPKIETSRGTRRGPLSRKERQRMCRLKYRKCQRLSPPSDDDRDPSMIINFPRALPVVRGISSRDMSENCNAYCRWLKRQLILAKDGEKPDHEMTLRELGDKYHETFGKTRCVLVDLSGTLFEEGAPTENAVAAIELLRKFGITVRFVTNSTEECKRLLLQRLSGLGFKVESQEVYTALTAARQLIEKNNLHPYFLLGENAMEDFEGIDTSNPNSVLVGLASTNFSYILFNKALRLLLSGAPIISVHKSRVDKLISGQLTLGPGPFIDILEYATSAKSYLVGKPSADFFVAAVEGTDCCKPEETVIIGDDVFADIEGALKCGMKAILVKTGIYQDDDENRIEELNPTLVAKNLYIAVRCIVGSVAHEQDLSTGETDTEDHVQTRKDKILKGETTTDLDFVQKVRCYVNHCDLPLLCLQPEGPRPPLLNPQDYYTKDSGKHPREIVGTQSNVILRSEAEIMKELGMGGLDNTLSRLKEQRTKNAK